MIFYIAIRNICVILQMYTGPMTRGSLIETQGDKLNQLKVLRKHHARSATTGAFG